MKMRRLKTLPYFGRWFGCLAVGRSGWPLGSFGFGFLGCSSCDSSPGLSPLVLVGVVCGGRLCGDSLLRYVCRVWAVACCCSALIILRALYLLYIAARRNFLTFWRAKNKVVDNFQCGQN